MNVLLIATSGEYTAVDLFPGTVIAYTVTKVDIGNLTARGVSYSNQISVPRSRTNEILFALAAGEPVSSSLQYNLFDCKMISNGVEVLTDGRCVVKKVDAGEYYLEIYESMFNIFTFIKGKDTSYLNYIATTGWDGLYQDTARTNTTGIISAVLNWGRAGAIFQTNYFLPCFFYGEMVRKTLELTGLTLSGSILTDTRFTDLVIPYGKEDFFYPESFVEPYRLNVGKSANTSVLPLAIGAVHRAVMNTIVTQGSAAMYSTSAYEATIPAVAGLTGTFMKITGSMRFVFSAFWPAGPGGGDLFTVQLQRDRGGMVTPIVTLNLTEAAYPAGGDASTGAVQVFFQAADKIYMEVLGSNNNLLEVTYTTVTNFTLTTNTTIGPFIVWNKILPDISLTDLIRDFSVRFGIVFKQVGNVLHMKTLQEIITDTINAVDWTSKRVNTHKDVTSFTSEYAQVNEFLHSDLIDDPLVGRGTIDIISTALAPIKTIFTSALGNSITGPVGVYNVATIPVYDATSTALDTFASSPGLRVLTLKARTTETAITFNAIARTDYRLAYFLDTEKAKDTGFKYFLSQFYADLGRSLQRTKMKDHYYNLSEQDVADYDPHKLIYDNGSYYIVNKIFTFVSGKVSKVNVFRI